MSVKNRFRRPGLLPAGKIFLLLFLAWATVLNAIEALPRLLLFWRALIFRPMVRTSHGCYAASSKCHALGF
jgi:hypothetical protein